MTHSNDLDITYTDGAPLAPDDIRVALARAYQGARAVLQRIDSTNADLPTPCADWNVGTLGQHLIEVFQRVVLAPTGADIVSRSVIADIAVGDIATTAAELGGQMHAAWNDDAALDLMVDAPFGTMPGAMVLAIWATETLVHTWDLTVALGLTMNWPEPDTTISFEQSVGSMPAERPVAEIPFDDAVTIADDRPSIERLAAFLGRDVDAWVR